VNRGEIARLLAVVASIDKRTVGESDINSWHLLLGPIDYQRAQDAVVAHFRHKPGVWLEAGHIWTLACTRTDGEYEETVARQAAIEASQEQPCEQGTYCPRCKAVHHADQACKVLVKRPTEHARVVEMFKPRAITSPPATRPTRLPEDVPVEVDQQAADAMEAERRRQLDQLAQLA